MQPIIGIVADDLTGGMETAAMLVALGVDCGFVTRPALVQHFANSPAVVVAQKTRVVPAAEATTTLEWVPARRCTQRGVPSGCSTR